MIDPYVNLIISAIIVTSCFIGVIILIFTDKLNRAIAALSGAAITFFALTFINGTNFVTFLGFMFGSVTDNFVNLHSLILILGMMFIVQICNEAGVFQFLAFKLVQWTKGEPTKLLLIICALSVLLSALLNNILAVIILIPLIITISRILSINPTPYIITSAILVNIGGMVFSISSIPNILISSAAGITFADFFLNVGLISLLIFGMTLVFFHLVYRKRLVAPRERLVKVLDDFNPWNFVPDKQLFYKSIIILCTVIIGLMVIPSQILSPDIIAITGGIVLIVISKLEPKEIIDKIDFELILYLLGIFIISGALELVGVINLVGIGLFHMVGGDSFSTILLILWVSAFLSSAVDNIPITKVLIPVVGVMGTNFSAAELQQSYYSLAFGANLGDNLTPMGDNILVMNIAEKNERPINASTFFKLGFVTSVIQLSAISLYFILILRTFIGIILVLCLLGIIAAIYITYYLDRKYGENEFSKFYKIKTKAIKSKQSIYRFGGKIKKTFTKLGEKIGNKNSKKD